MHLQQNRRSLNSSGNNGMLATGVHTTTTQPPTRRSGSCPLHGIRFLCLRLFEKQAPALIFTGFDEFLVGLCIEHGRVTLQQMELIVGCVEDDDLCKRRD